MAAFRRRNQQRRKTFMTRISIHKPTALRLGAVASCYWQVVDGFDAMPSNGPGRAMK
jgi:hypothetical protein